ncbi:MAG: hypothetical protein ACKVQA_05985 [Burkholderiales bacterium]
MSARPTHPPPLSEEHVQFIQGGVAIDLATRDFRNIPRVALGIGVRVSPDRRRVSLIVADRMIGRFTEALKGTRAIAAVFALPSTHRAIQIKGSDAVIEAVLETDQALVEKTIAAFAADLLPWGVPEAAARAVMTYRPNELIAISFTPDAVYEQTPGPKAGTRL